MNIENQQEQEKITSDIEKSAENKQDLLNSESLTSEIKISNKKTLNSSDNKNIAHRVLEKLNKDKYFVENVHDRLYNEAKQRMVRKNQVNNMLNSGTDTELRFSQFYSDNLAYNEMTPENHTEKIGQGLSSEDGQKATNR